jgi:hypothetical protein
MEEQEIGEVVKYFAKIEVAAIDLTKASLSVGDKIHIKGHTTDLEQVIESMQIENQSVERAEKGASIGVKVKERVRPNDKVYKVVE